MASQTLLADAAYWVGISRDRLKEAVANSRALVGLWDEFTKATEKGARTATGQALGFETIASKVKSIGIHFSKLHETEDIAFQSAATQISRHFNVINSALNGTIAIISSITLSRVLDETAKLNRALLYANGLIQQRNKYLKESYQVLVATGASVETVADGVKALVKYGIENTQQFRSSLELVIKMKEGLDLSVEAGAELSFIFGRLDVPLSRVANLVTVLANTTRLTADEAARVANELGRAALFLRPDTRAIGISGALKTVEDLEAMVKAGGGIQGEITGMVSSMMTTIEGAATARIFGLSGPSAGTEQGMDRIREQIMLMLRPAARARSTGNDIGFIAQLEAIRTLLNDKVSIRTLAAMVEAMNDSNEARSGQLTIEQKWRDTIVHTGQMAQTVKQQLVSLLQAGMLPFVSGIRGLLSALNSILDVIRKSPTVFKVVTTAITVLTSIAIPFAAREIWRLGVAITALGAMARRSAGGLLASGTAQMMFPFVGGSAGRAFRTKLSLGGLAKMLNGFMLNIPRVIGSILSSSVFVGAILAVGAGIVGWKLGRLISQVVDSMHASQSPISLTRKLEQSVSRRFVRDSIARIDAGDYSGMQGGILDFVNKQTRDYAAGKEGALSPRQTWLAIASIPDVLSAAIDRQSAQIQLGLSNIAEVSKADPQVLADTKEQIRLLNLILQVNQKVVNQAVEQKEISEEAATEIRRREMRTVIPYGTLKW